MKEWVLFDDAKREGREEARLDGIRGFVLDKLEDGVDKETILAKIQKVFSVSAEEAEKYWNMVK